MLVSRTSYTVIARARESCVDGALPPEAIQQRHSRVGACPRLCMYIAHHARSCVNWITSGLDVPYVRFPLPKLCNDGAGRSTH